jgi:hypothetical protein
VVSITGENDECPRKGKVSFSQMLEEWTDYLKRYFERRNEVRVPR